MPREGRQTVLGPASGRTRRASAIILLDIPAIILLDIPANHLTYFRRSPKIEAAVPIPAITKNVGSSKLSQRLPARLTSILQLLYLTAPLSYSSSIFLSLVPIIMFSILYSSNFRTLRFSKTVIEYYTVLKFPVPTFSVRRALSKNTAIWASSFRMRFWTFNHPSFLALGLLCSICSQCWG